MPGTQGSGRRRGAVTAAVVLFALGGPAGAVGAGAFQKGTYEGKSSKGDDISFKAGKRITKAKFHLDFTGGCPSGTYTFSERPRIKKSGKFKLVHKFEKDKVTLKGRLSGTKAKGRLKAVVYGRRAGRGPGRAARVKCTASYKWKAELQPG